MFTADKPLAWWAERHPGDGATASGTPAAGGDD